MICKGVPDWVSDERVRWVAQLSRDREMADLIERVGPCALSARRLAPFESLCQSIIHQQLSGKAAGAILGRFKRTIGRGRFPRPGRVLRARLSELRGVGLSAAKARYIKEIAVRAAAGKLPSLRDCEEMGDAELIQRLTEIKGVGRWTAEMLLIFNLGRQDVLPVNDLGVRRGFARAYRRRSLPEPDFLERVGRRWAPYRSVAAWYLWRAVDFVNGDDW